MPVTKELSAWIYVGDAIVQVANICHIQTWAMGCVLCMMNGDKIESNQPVESILDAIGIIHSPEAKNEQA